MKKMMERSGSGTRRLAMAGVFALGMLFSIAGSALPPNPGWLTFTYYNGEGDVVGERSMGTCPGMGTIEWGIQTSTFTYRSGTC